MMGGGGFILCRLISYERLSYPEPAGAYGRVLGPEGQIFNVRTLDTLCTELIKFVMVLRL